MSNPRKIRLGTRGSTLARTQTDWVAAQLKYRDFDIEIVPVATRGDQQSERPIGELGSTGVFTKQLQFALLENHIDVAIHSLKDLPTENIPGVSLAAVPQREVCNDVLISRGGESLDQLDAHSVIGTGSIRRAAQVLNMRPDLAVRDIRGNVETRLAKLEEEQFDAIVLAQAGLRRMGLEGRIAQVFDVEQMLPAVGQGALGLETRTDCQWVRSALESIDDRPSHAAALAERACLAALRGGCLAPVGALARVGGDQTITISAVVLDASGRRRLCASVRGHSDNPTEIGQLAAQELIDQGATDLLTAAGG